MDSNGIEKNDVVTESNLAETKCAKLSSYVINLLFSNKIDAGGPKRKDSRRPNSLPARQKSLGL